MNKYVFGLVLIAGWFMVLERPVYAYVDPGTGSMLTQLVIGGVLAVIVTLRTGWQRMRGWFQRRREDIS